MSAWRLRGLRSRCPRWAGAETRTTTGALADGTVSTEWTSLIPGTASCSSVSTTPQAGGAGSALSQALLARGYAMGGTTRLRHGLGHRPVDRQPARHGRHCDRLYGPSDPARSCSARRSVRIPAPRRYRHAPTGSTAPFSMCGGLAGTVALWKQQARWGFRRAEPCSHRRIRCFRSSAFPWTRDDGAAGVVEDAGRCPGEPRRVVARIALAAVPRAAAHVVGSSQGAAWLRPISTGKQQGLYDSLAGGPLPMIGQAMSSRNEIERRSGGKYLLERRHRLVRQLARAGGRELVHRVVPPGRSLSRRPIWIRWGRAPLSCRLIRRPWLGQRLVSGMASWWSRRLRSTESVTTFRL